MRARVRELYEEHLSFALSVPAYLWQIYFLCIPLLFITIYSLMPDNLHGSWGITFSHYTDLINGVFARIILNSALLAVTTATVCLVLAFPVAYYLAVHARRWKNVLLVFLILPSWTSFIIQIYSWFFLLQKRGVFSTLLCRFGFASEALSLLNNRGATVLGMAYCYLPFMVLPLYTVLERMDKRLFEAAADLGASRWQVIRDIVLPLSRSGIQVGLVLVMVPAFGEFAIPDLMGGFKDVYVGRMIMEKFLMFRNWHSGAAVVMVSFLIPILVAGFIHLSRSLAPTKGQS